MEGLRERAVMEAPYAVGGGVTATPGLTPLIRLRFDSIRVQTVAVAASQWEMTPAQIAAEYELSEALAFYEAHRAEIDCAIKAEQTAEEKQG